MIYLKKLRQATILLILIFLMTTFITPVQSINTTKQNTTEFSTQLSTASDSYLLKSTTIGTITTLIIAFGPGIKREWNFF